MKRILATLSLVVIAAQLGGCAVSPTPGATLASGSNSSFRHTETTSASRDAVWELWTTPETWPTWEHTLKAASIEAPMAVGVRGKLTPASGPPSTFEVTEFVPGERYAFETRLPLGRLRIVRYFEPVADPTTFTHEVSFHGLSAFIFSGRFGPVFREALPIVMSKIAEVAESSDAEAPIR